MVLGGFFVFLNYSMAMDGGYFLPKLAVAGPGLFIIGLGLLVFPGQNISLVELRQSRDFNAKDWLLASPMMHKLAWGVAALIGLVCGLAFEGWLAG